MMIAFKNILLIILISIKIGSTVAQEPTAKVSVEKDINVVSERFLSYSVDPKLVLIRDDLLLNDHGLCMAKSLSPAFVRIAGPSTNDLVIDNSLVAIKQMVRQQKDDEKIYLGTGIWETFTKWAHSAGLTPFLALGNGERTRIGDRWDTKTALRVLAAAERVSRDEVVWQLGYECKNQTLAEYMNDLNSLKTLIDAYPSRKKGLWRLVGGDISKCLNTNDSEGFKDFLMDSNKILDAVFISGIGSLKMFDYLNNENKLEVVDDFVKSNTSLWYSIKARDNYMPMEEDDKAIMWVNDLGSAAANGIRVLFKELKLEDITKPTMSYYASVLHKMLVGRRVLGVEMSELDLLGNANVTLYAHCARLRGRPASGAVTLFGTNPNEKYSKVSIMLTGRESAGEAMQFILTTNKDGNILVNGEQMTYEGDLYPVVKKLKPFTTLTVQLPEKSVGFWVIANAKLKACHYDDSELAPLKEGRTNGTTPQKDATAQQLQEILLSELKKSDSRVKRSYAKNELPILQRSHGDRTNVNHVLSIKKNGNLIPLTDNHRTHNTLIKEDITKGDDIFSILEELAELLILLEKSGKEEIVCISPIVKHLVIDILCDIYPKYREEEIQGIIEKIKTKVILPIRTKRDLDATDNDDKNKNKMIQIEGRLSELRKSNKRVKRSELKYVLPILKRTHRDKRSVNDGPLIKKTENIIPYDIKDPFENDNIYNILGGLAKVLILFEKSENDEAARLLPIVKKIAVDIFCKIYPNYGEEQIQNIISIFKTKVMLPKRTKREVNITDNDGINKGHNDTKNKNLKVENVSNDKLTSKIKNKVIKIEAIDSDIESNANHLESDKWNAETLPKDFIQNSSANIDGIYINSLENEDRTSDFLTSNGEEEITNVNSIKQSESSQQTTNNLQELLRYSSSPTATISKDNKNAEERPTPKANGIEIPLDFSINNDKMSDQNITSVKVDDRPNIKNAEELRERSEFSNFSSEGENHQDKLLMTNKETSEKYLQNNSLNIIDNAQSLLKTKEIESNQDVSDSDKNKIDSEKLQYDRARGVKIPSIFSNYSSNIAKENGLNKENLKNDNKIINGDGTNTKKMDNLIEYSEPVAFASNINEQQSTLTGNTGESRPHNENILNRILNLQKLKQDLSNTEKFKFDIEKLTPKRALGVKIPSTPRNLSLYTIKEVVSNNDDIHENNQNLKKQNTENANFYHPNNNINILNKMLTLSKNNMNGIKKDLSSARIKYNTENLKIDKARGITPRNLSNTVKEVILNVSDIKKVQNIANDGTIIKTVDTLREYSEPVATVSDVIANENQPIFKENTRESKLHATFNNVDVSDKIENLPKVSLSPSQVSLSPKTAKDVVSNKDNTYEKMPKAPDFTHLKNNVNYLDKMLTLPKINVDYIKQNLSNGRVFKFDSGKNGFDRARGSKISSTYPDISSKTEKRKILNFVEEKNFQNMPNEKKTLITKVNELTNKPVESLLNLKSSNHEKIPTTSKYTGASELHHPNNTVDMFYKILNFPQSKTNDPKKNLSNVVVKHDYKKIKLNEAPMVKIPLTLGNNPSSLKEETLSRKDTNRNDDDQISVAKKDLQTNKYEREYEQVAAASTNEKKPAILPTYGTPTSLISQHGASNFDNLFQALRSNTNNLKPIDLLESKVQKNENVQITQNRFPSIKIPSKPSSSDRKDITVPALKSPKLDEKTSSDITSLILDIPKKLGNRTTEKISSNVKVTKIGIKNISLPDNSSKFRQNKVGDLNVLKRFEEGFNDKRKTEINGKESNKKIPLHKLPADVNKLTASEIKLDKFKNIDEELKNLKIYNLLKPQINSGQTQYKGVTIPQLLLPNNTISKPPLNGIKQIKEINLTLKEQNIQEIKSVKPVAKTPKNKVPNISTNELTNTLRLPNLKETKSFRENVERNKLKYNNLNILKDAPFVEINKASKGFPVLEIKPLEFLPKREKSIELSDKKLKKKNDMDINETTLKQYTNRNIQKLINDEAASQTLLTRGVKPNLDGFVSDLKITGNADEIKKTKLSEIKVLGIEKGKLVDDITSKLKSPQSRLETLRMSQESKLKLPKYKADGNDNKIDLKKLKNVELKLSSPILNVFQKSELRKENVPTVKMEEVKKSIQKLTDSIGIRKQVPDELIIDQNLPTYQEDIRQKLNDLRGDTNKHQKRENILSANMNRHKRYASQEGEVYKGESNSLSNTPCENIAHTRLKTNVAMNSRRRRSPFYTESESINIDPLIDTNEISGPDKDKLIIFDEKYVSKIFDTGNLNNGYAEAEKENIFHKLNTSENNPEMRSKYTHKDHFEKKEKQDVDKLKVTENLLQTNKLMAPIMPILKPIIDISEKLKAAWNVLIRN